MEEITVQNTNTTITAMDDVKNEKLEAKIEGPKKNRIQVSNTKKPLFFYLNLAKRLIKQHNFIVLSALGMAIPTVVTIAEILKTNGLVFEKQVLTSTIGTKDEAKGRIVQKPKIEIVLEKNEKVENLKAATGTTPKKAAPAPAPALAPADANTKEE
ncbi:unnamed protein product [Camellia sinensis]|uniref:DNA/RNA-binding protein Alba-like domain-containing protein n=1 Tax=Camellia sinensis TaxID=4442 RepID=A0A7J7HDY1_CAMSI|nr:hypothetical protein HYC85_012730 [Camellia sinensis]